MFCCQLTSRFWCKDNETQTNKAPNSRGCFKRVFFFCKGNINEVPLILLFLLYFELNTWPWWPIQSNDNEFHTLSTQQVSKVGLISGGLRFTAFTLLLCVLIKLWLALVLSTFAEISLSILHTFMYIQIKTEL